MQANQCNLIDLYSWHLYNWMLKECRKPLITVCRIYQYGMEGCSQSGGGEREGKWGGKEGGGGGREGGRGRGEGQDHLHCHFVIVIFDTKLQNAYNHVHPDPPMTTWWIYLWWVRVRATIHIMLNWASNLISPWEKVALYIMCTIHAKCDPSYSPVYL